MGRDRLAQCERLLRIEGGTDRADEVARPRTGARGHHGQRNRAWNHRHPTASGRRRRCRYHARRDAPGVRAQYSARAHRQTGGHRRCGLAAGPRRPRRLRRPDHPDQRRDDTVPDMSEHNQPVQPVDGTVVPRYAGFSTFARLPRIGDVPFYDVAVVGIPFDTGVSYRPGARFGPAHVRQCSRVLRPYHPQMEVLPFATQQVVDAGDIACTPFDIAKAITQIEEQASALTPDGARLITIGGDHPIAYPLLRAHERRYGPVALVHFDAHLDTWDTYFDAPLTHGTPFRRAAEEGLFISGHSAHIGIRGALYSPDDLDNDAELGFTIVHCSAFETRTVTDVVEQLRTTTGDHPLYVS